MGRPQKKCGCFPMKWRPWALPYILVVWDKTGKTMFTLGSSPFAAQSGLPVEIARRLHAEILANREVG
jgi:hypothetical protein